MSHVQPHPSVVSRHPRIAVVGAFSERGGLQRRLMNMIAVWVSHGIEVDIVALRNTPIFYPEEIPESVQCLRIRRTSRLSNKLGLWRYFHSRRPDAVLALRHIPNMLAIATSRWPGAGCPPVFVNLPNSVTGSRRRRKCSDRERKFREIRSVYRYATGIIVLSKAGRRELLDELGMKDVPIHVIPNAVITNQMRQRAQEHPEHPWLDRNRSFRVVLAVGRLHRQKGFDVLIEAFEHLEVAGEVRLVILGEGPARKELEALIDARCLRDRVALPGFHNNPYACMSRSDLFVLSSRWEGFPNVLAEAVALGVPVVSTDCPTGPAEILGNEETGRLVPVDDSDRLREAIEEMLNRSDQHRATVNKEILAYDAERVAAQYLDTMLPGSWNGKVMQDSVNHERQTDSEGKPN